MSIPDFPHYVEVAQLRRFLEKLPDDWAIVPNYVGNLAICTKDDRYAGFIECLENSQELVLFPEEQWTCG